MASEELARPVDPRLEPFELDNRKWGRKKKRAPWQQRYELIQKVFPSVVELDWHDVLKVESDGEQDIPVGEFMQLMRVIFVVDQNQGKDGNRAALDYDRFKKTWRQVAGRDYSQLPFNQAFAIISRGDSLRTAARKTSLPRSRVDRLRRGLELPSVDDMRLVAKAYGKDPSYFHEYRAEYIMAAIAHKLNAEPDQTVVLFRQLVRAT